MDYTQVFLTDQMEASSHHTRTLDVETDEQLAFLRGALLYDLDYQRIPILCSNLEGLTAELVRPDPHLLASYWRYRDWPVAAFTAFYGGSPDPERECMKAWDDAAAEECGVPAGAVLRLLDVFPCRPISFLHLGKLFADGSPVARETTFLTGLLIREFFRQCEQKWPHMEG